MTVGASLFLIAAGAILRYAVTWRNSDIDIPTVGLILLIVGVIGLVVSIAYMVMATDRRRDPVVRDPRDPRDPPRY
jgi:beta-lactamase regulating signal transducer with metallopeptidase domain